MHLLENKIDSSITHAQKYKINDDQQLGENSFHLQVDSYPPD